MATTILPRGLLEPIQGQYLPGMRRMWTMDPVVAVAFTTPIVQQTALRGQKDNKGPHPGFPQKQTYCQVASRHKSLAFSMSHCSPVSATPVLRDRCISCRTGDDLAWG